MTEPTKWNRRRPLYGMLAVALVALAIPISYAVAASANSRVTAPVKKYDNGCGPAPSKNKIIGSATFQKNKSGSITVDNELTGAVPGTDYYFYFYADTHNGSPVSCGVGDYFGKAKADSSGRVSKTYTVPAADVSGYNGFWAYSYSYTASVYERSDSVTL